MFRLEKLEISGFKSFADRTSLTFGEGITGIVGPNGCGKSNVAEAISWVLGEQSAKNLRGGKMEDVIFNGTRDRKPTGMSEVLLTLVAIEDIAARDTDDAAARDGQEYDAAVEIAERTAAAARALVEELEPPQPSEDQAALEQAAESNSVDSSELVDSSKPAAVSDEVSAEESEEAQAKAKTEPARAPRLRKRKPIVISAGERITVGRRLYRTGDSDYLMNGRPCLLRDIQDLFAGTGLGGAHYAIIEQGRIGQILSSKPLDRRALIEEAAGITKFKSRKRAVELKLESAKQNLTRLNDIISEVERQVNSLKRQAQKARRYRRLREEMRALMKLVYTADYYRLSEAAERSLGELEEAERSQRELDALLIEREGEHRVVSSEARGAEDNLASLKEMAASVELEADRARNRRIFEEQQLKELSARIEELEGDQQALDARLQTVEQESETRAADLKSLETELAEQQVDLHNREIEYQAETARLRDAENEIEQLRQRMLTEIGQVERLRNLSANLVEALRRLDLRQSNLQAELERATARLDEASSEYNRVGGELEGNRALLVELTGRIGECSTTLDLTRHETGGLRSELEAVRAECAAAEHRLASLEDLDAHRAYYSDAVQQVLSPEQAARINALGTLADFVEVEPQYERLVESLFGRELQCVLVPTIDDALTGVEFIKAEGLGRGAFLVVGLHGGEGGPDEANKQDDQASPSDERWPAEGGEYISISHQLPPADYLFIDSVAARDDSDFESFRQDQQVDPFNDQDGFSKRDEFNKPGEFNEHDKFDKHGEFVSGIDQAQSRFDKEAALEAARFQLDVLCAIDLLTMRPEIKIVVERAFPEKCTASVAPDMEAALQLSIENASRIYVTYDGEQVVNGRLIVTGAQAGQKGTSLLGLKREIKQLRAQAEMLGGEEQRFAASLDQAQKRLEEVEAEASSLDRELHQHEKALAARDSQFEGLARDLERAQQHVRVVEAELEQAADERAELESHVEQLKNDLELATASRDSVQQSLTLAQSASVEMRAKIEQASEQLSAARASVAAHSERLYAARADMRRIESEAEELQSRINRNRLELYESHNRTEQLTASQAEGDSASARFDNERAALAERISVAGGALAAARARVDELEAILADLRQASAAARERRSRIEVERARAQSEAEHLTRSCFSELAMSLEDVVTSVELGRAAGRMIEPGNQVSNETDPRSVDDSQESQNLESESQVIKSSDEQSTSDYWQLGSDMEAARARLDELRVKLDDLGPVNMMALDELEESEGRFKFLSEQRRDILDSIRSTEEALSEIKRRSRERFRHAFTHINENFQHMFVELFGGGRGEMILIDEDDVLESGIDLIAQPPGKRLQNVLLLSGGEKAMAAIALVLSIFQYRPSPFCILDEVDAPLDEINVGRFSGKVLEMSQETQFLVITHNKRTMESARALYGVTMEEPGVSKLVSVKFE